MTTQRSPTRLRLEFSLARDGFDLQIDQTLELGETLAIYGPSGSGKTSILRVIAGLEPRASGTVRFGDDCWQDATRFVPAHKRSVGLVFQDARLFPHLNVEANLDLARRAARSSERFSKADVVGALEIRHLLARDTRELSGGEAQRVAIARTLLAQPRLLLMDEPVSSLDVQSRRETIEYIDRLTGSLGLPLIYVTHDAGEVARLARTTLLLDNGRAMALGRTPEVFSAMASTPAGGETASILEASVAGTTAGLTELEIGAQRLRLAMSGRKAGERTQLRVLARDVVIATRKIDDTSIRNVLGGTVAALEPLDSQTVEVRIRLEDQILKAHVTKLAVTELELTTGSSVYAMIKSVALGTAA